MRAKVSLTALFGVVAMIVLMPRSAHAYIDPGTGSFILQMLVATLLGALFTMKLWFRTAKIFFGRLFGSKSVAPATTEPDSTEQVDEPPKKSTEAP